jgi:hypothetical protein
VIRPRQFQSHQHRHRHADEHRSHGEQKILYADHLVINAEDVFAYKTGGRGVTMHFASGVRPMNSFHLCHRFNSPNQIAECGLKDFRFEISEAPARNPNSEIRNRPTAGIS